LVDTSIRPVIDTYDPASQKTLPGSLSLGRKDDFSSS